MKIFENIKSENDRHATIIDDLELDSELKGAVVAISKACKGQETDSTEMRSRNERASTSGTVQNPKKRIMANRHGQLDDQDSDSLNSPRMKHHGRTEVSEAIPIFDQYYRAA